MSSIFDSSFSLFFPVQPSPVMSAAVTHLSIICFICLRCLTLSPPIPSRLCILPYWSNPPFLISDIWAFWRSGLSARVPECQKLKGLDQYGAKPFEQQQFGTAGVEVVNDPNDRCRLMHNDRSAHCSLSSTFWNLLHWSDYLHADGGGNGIQEKHDTEPLGIE